MVRKALRPNPGRVQVSKPITLPAPIRGWMTDENLADMPPEGAVVLTNWFPDADTVRLRRGSALWADGMGGSAVESLMPYQAGTTIEMFAAAGGTIWDVTSSGAAAATSETGNASNRWQHIQFATSGGHYLYCVNGQDAPVHYDGSTWANPSLTGPSSTASLVQVWSNKSRLWFAEEGTATAWYLAPDSIAGTLSDLELGGIFTLGGYLMAGGSWTIDAGEGMDDYCVFVSSEGEVAVYAGTDPSDPNAWALRGVYRIGKPIGRRCLLKVGGDLAILCEDGVLPLSRALVLDRAAARKGALTANIQKACNDAIRTYGAQFGWQIIAYPRGTMAIVNVPISSLSEAVQFVMNTLTGAWARFEGQNAVCWALLDGNLFYGTPTGEVFRADVGSADGEEPISATSIGAFQIPGGRVATKSAKLMRPIIQSDTEIAPAIGVSVDYRVSPPSSIPAVAPVSGGVSDVNEWADDVADDPDDMLWAGDSVVVIDWQTVVGVGYAFSAGVAVSLEGVDPDADVDVRLVAFNLILEEGAPV